ncbi:MAG: AAA family ATPase [Rhizobiaceae bacterium]|nr:AAA family ATPase [Rhizobiaceae bacterium]
MAPATLWLVAGPNGVGKTTFAFRQIKRLTGETSFVNLDEIARGLSPLAPESGAIRASRVALSMIDDLIAGNGRGRHSFSLETTLAGRTHLRTLDRAKAAGFRVHLLYFCVADEEMALARIARRVAEGGHDVPEKDARRRFRRSIANFPLYAARADLWQVFDANPFAPKVVAEGSGHVPDYVGDLSGLPDALAEGLARLS